MKKYQGAVVDRRGNAIGTVSVKVLNHGTPVLSTIYSDEGITPQSNPFSCDAYGRWGFYVANGRYDIEFSGAMVNTYLMEDVVIEEAGGADATYIRGHIVDETDLTNDRVLVYKETGDKFVYEAKGVPEAHAATHQNGGGDEISVDDLSGLLADPQTPVTHAAAHQNGGGDEISVDDLSGLLADPQTPVTHAATHQDGGGDEISVDDLSGLLADPQTPATHAAAHQDGGEDEISVNALSGTLADRQDANKIQGHTIDETAIANDRILVYKTTGDKFIYEAKSTPGVHGASHEDGGGDEISIDGLLGQTGEKQDADRIQGHVVEETALADDKVLVYKVTGDKFVYEPKGTPAGHHTSHELGGGDPIDCTGLVGASGGGGGGGDFLVMQVFS